MELTPVTQAIVDEPNCAANRDRLWVELYRQVEANGRLPEASVVEREVRALARTPRQGDALARVYREIRDEVGEFGREDAMRALAEMEIGDRTTPEKAARQDALEASLREARAVSEEVEGHCDDGPGEPESEKPGEKPTKPEETVDPVAMFETWRKQAHGVVYGAYKTFSVAYQSCNATELPALTSSVPSVSGIEIVGEHSNGVGLKREVADAAAVFRTNPFYAGRVSPAPGCFAATGSPLIYDYGGKPYASASANSVDLFRNAGSGTSALGIDCSGFVATSVITGGLRLKSGVSSKSAQSGGVNAAMFANPAGNGLSCFARVASTATQKLRAGDVIANSGHVVLVDRVGADPFGVANAKSAEDCAAASYAKFDFTVVQSSPSKGGIGLNRYRAKDYLAGSSSMRTGLEAYAKSFCEVKLGLKSPSTLANATKAVIVRHSGAGGCVDKRVPIERESCLKSCVGIAPVDALLARSGR